MKKIPLTQGKFAIVDDCDYEYLMQWKWHYRNDDYAVRTDRTNGMQQTIRMHRIILERMGFKNFVRSDHINRDRLDNRRCNLRSATNRQSNCNRSRFRNNISGYIGVCWYKQYGNWHAQIGINGKQTHIGYYDNLKEAAKAYNKAALKYHGEFAVLNEV